MSAALLLAACGGGDSSSDDNKAPERPQPLLGVTSGALFDPGAPLESEVKVMKESGVTTLRAPFYWWTAEPAKGQPNFEATDPIVKATAESGIELLPIVVGTPSWAARHPKLRNSPPAGTAAYAAFMKELIGRYGPDGSFWSDNPDVPKQPIEAWQIWNEPNHLHYWSDQPFERDYVALARAARTAIKRADPNAKVVMAGFADR